MTHVSVISDLYENILKQLIFVFLIPVCIFFAVGYGSAGMHEISASQINYSSVNKPLKEFLDSIKSQTPLTVYVDEEWLSKPVSLDLENASIEEGLQRAFNQLGLDYALTFDTEQNAILVHIPEHSLSKEDIRTAQPGTPVSVSPQHQTAVPPEKGNPHPPTEEELSQMAPANKKNIEPLDLSAVPPDADGQPGITEREVLRLKDSAIKNENDLSDVPDE